SGVGLCRAVKHADCLSVRNKLFKKVDLLLYGSKVGNSRNISAGSIVVGNKSAFSGISNCRDNNGNVLCQACYGLSGGCSDGVYKIVSVVNKFFGYGLASGLIVGSVLLVYLIVYAGVVKSGDEA